MLLCIKNMQKPMRLNGIRSSTQRHHAFVFDDERNAPVRCAQSAAGSMAFTFKRTRAPCAFTLTRPYTW